MPLYLNRLFVVLGDGLRVTVPNGVRPVSNKAQTKYVMPQQQQIDHIGCANLT